MAAAEPTVLLRAADGAEFPVDEAAARAFSPMLSALSLDDEGATPAFDLHLSGPPAELFSELIAAAGEEPGKVLGKARNKDLVPLFEESSFFEAPPQVTGAVARAIFDKALVGKKEALKAVLRPDVAACLPKVHARFAAELGPERKTFRNAPSEAECSVGDALDLAVAALAALRASSDPDHVKNLAGALDRRLKAGRPLAPDVPLLHKKQNPAIDVRERPFYLFPPAALPELASAPSPKGAKDIRVARFRAEGASGTPISPTTPPVFSNVPHPRVYLFTTSCYAEDGLERLAAVAAAASAASLPHRYEVLPPRPADATEIPHPSGLELHRTCAAVLAVALGPADPRAFVPWLLHSLRALPGCVPPATAAELEKLLLHPLLAGCGAHSSPEDVEKRVKGSTRRALAVAARAWRAAGGGMDAREAWEAAVAGQEQNGAVSTEDEGSDD